MLLPDVSMWQLKEWSQFLRAEHWEKPVREITRREAISFVEMKAGLSSSNATFVLDNEHVIKIFPPWLKEGICVETEILGALKDKPEIPAPHILAQGIFEDQIQWPYFIMNCLPGQSVAQVRDYIEPDNWLEIASHLGEIVRALHRIDYSSFHTTNPTKKCWKTILESERKKAIKEIQDAEKLPQKLRDELLAFLRPGVEECIDGTFVLLHGELCAKHLMLSATDGKWKIVGLIDFAGVEVGPREFEWGDLWLDLFAQNSEAMRTFMSAYDPTIKIDAEFCRKGVLLFLLCSGYGPFGAAVGPIDLTEWIRRYPDGISQSGINSLLPFQESLWPSSLWQDN